MSEEHKCNCQNNDDYNNKKLELLSMGTNSQRMQEKLLKYVIILFSIFIICITVMVTYGINRYHHYMMNTERIETKVITEDNIVYDDNNIAGGNIINNSNLHNNTIGGNYGTKKNSNKENK